MTNILPSRLRRRLLTLLGMFLTLCLFIFQPATAKADQCEAGCIWWVNNVCLQTQTCCIDKNGQWYCVTN
jgi:hypothetical protein